MKEFIATENDAGQRVDKFVEKVTVGLPRSLLYKAIRTKKIKVNRKRCEVGQILCKGDSLQLFLSPDFFGEAEERFLTLEPNLQVVYEDENLLICDKPEGLSCHSDEAQQTGTLIDHIKAYLYRKGEFCPNRENSFAPALCNRIDRNTSGLCIAAKNAAALREMNEMIRLHLVNKEYLTWCHGRFPAEKKVTLFLKKDSEKNKVCVSDTPKKDHLTAVTEIFPLSYDKALDRTLCRVRLYTGRTHQIRATFSHLGFPLVGDSKYGTDRHDPLFSHQALRAAYLSFSPQKDSPLAYLAEVSVTAPGDERFRLKK